MDLDHGWLALIFGIAFGLIPPRWLYKEGCRHLTLIEARSSSLRRSGSSGRKRRTWWKLSLFWLDPFRGYASAHLGALGIGHLCESFPDASLFAQVIQGLIVVTVLVIQMEAGRQEAGKLLAPVPFLLGFTTGLYLNFGVVGGAVAFLAVATMLGTHSFVWGYVVAGVAAGAIGLIFLGPSPALVIFAATACAPALYAFLRRAPLVLPFRG
jgi:hypothetical protein